MSETCRGHLWEKIIVKLFASSWYIFLTVQHVTVLNTVGNCNTVVCIIILSEHRRIYGPSLTETSLCDAWLFRSVALVLLSVDFRSSELVFLYTVLREMRERLGCDASLVGRGVRRRGSYVSVRGEFRPRQTRQLPRAVNLKGRLLSCQSY